jgi:hypothetical protein
MADLGNSNPFTPPGRAPYGGMPGQFAGPAFNPLAEALASWGVQQPPGFWQNLSQWAAPGVDRAERMARGVVGMAGEATGVPAAGRAGEAFAAGEPMRGTGEALMALPSRMGAILGFPLSQAEAQTPDPRQARITKLDRDIAGHRKTLEDLGRQNFRSTQARQNASKPYLDAIGSAQAERDRLQGQLDTEFKALTDQRLAEERGAAWRNTPTATAYPGVQYGSAGLGALGSAYLAFRGARAPVVQFNQRLQSVVDRQRAAIDKANDKTLTAAERNQARRTAEAAQREYGDMVANQPHLTLGNRLTTGALSGAATDLGMMAPTVADYIYSFQDPEGALHGYSAGQLNPLENPGRFGVGAVTGGFAGMLGQEIGERFPGIRVPPSYAAETAGLPSRYQSPRKPSAPRKRK